MVWFDPQIRRPEVDAATEAQLRRAEPSINWSVRNQARMHTLNGDAPYRSVEDAISRWPETATAIAVRLKGGVIEILAPHGLDDLFGLVVKPTPAFTGSKLPMFHERVQTKHWLERWPDLTVRDA